MSKDIKRNIVQCGDSHDKDDGFDLLCSLEKREGFHGDKNLRKSCKELLNSHCGDEKQ